MGDDLVEKVKAAARARSDRADRGIRRRRCGTGRARRAASAFDIVVIGISTGGPQALKSLIPQLPADLPVPVAIVLHMPVGYTELYARKLDELSALHVRRSADGTRSRPGVVSHRPGRPPPVASAERRGAVVTHLDVRPLDTPHRPSVDVAVSVGGRRLSAAACSAS